MKKMLKYADDRGRLYYATSQNRFAQYTRTSDIKTAVFQGETMLTGKQTRGLERIGNGIYKKEN